MTADAWVVSWTDGFTTSREECATEALARVVEGNKRAAGAKFVVVWFSSGSDCG